MTRLKKKSGDRYDLGRPKVAPTGKMGIFVSATDGCAFCDRDNLGRPMVAPTIKKDDRRNNEITSNL